MSDESAQQAEFINQFSLGSSPVSEPIKTKKTQPATLPPTAKPISQPPKAKTPITEKIQNEKKGVPEKANITPAPSKPVTTPNPSIADNPDEWQDF